MKVTVKPEPSREFEPITITIEIRSKDELAALWHRLDVAGIYLAKRYLSSTPKVPFPAEWSADTAHGGNSVDSTEELFKAIDAAAVDRVLRHGGQIGH